MASTVHRERSRTVNVVERRAVEIRHAARPSTSLRTNGIRADPHAAGTAGCSDFGGGSGAGAGAGADSGVSVAGVLPDGIGASALRPPNSQPSSASMKKPNWLSYRLVAV